MTVKASPQAIFRPLMICVVAVSSGAWSTPSLSSAADTTDEQFCQSLTKQYKAGMTELCRAMRSAADAGWEYLASANENDIWFIKPGRARLSMWVHVEYRNPVKGRVMSSRHLYEVNCTSFTARQIQATVYAQRELRGAPLEHTNDRGQPVTAPPSSILEGLVSATCKYWTQ